MGVELSKIAYSTLYMWNPSSVGKRVALLSAGRDTVSPDSTDRFQGKNNKWSFFSASTMNRKERGRNELKSTMISPETQYSKIKVSHCPGKKLSSRHLGIGSKSAKFVSGAQLTNSLYFKCWQTHEVDAPNQRIWTQATNAGDMNSNRCTNKLPAILAKELFTISELRNHTRKEYIDTIGIRVPIVRE